jgi:hypothetical protein
MDNCGRNLMRKQLETQSETITRYARENDRLTKERDALRHKDQHAQAYIIKIKKLNADLTAQLTPEAKADWIF